MDSFKALSSETQTVKSTFTAFEDLDLWYNLMKFTWLWLERHARYNGAPKSLFSRLIFYLLHLPLTVTLLKEIYQGAELREAQARFDNNSNDLAISRSILSMIFEG